MKVVAKAVSTLFAAITLVAIALVHAGAADFRTAAVEKKLIAPELGPIEPISTKWGSLGAKPPAQADLAVISLGVTSDGRMTYVVANIGQTAANSPFVADLYIGGKREDTIKHNPLPARSQQRVVSNLARPEVCTATLFRAAVDTQQLVAEADEGNNARERTLVPPCPDLVVDIDKDSVSNGLKYRAKVQVTNRGNLSTKREFTVMLMGTSGGISPTGWGALPVLNQRRIGPLAPGQTASFYEGGDHLGTTTFNYRALVDRFDEIRESNESNNEKRETMGGGY